MMHRETTFYIKNAKPILLCGKPVMWELETDGAFRVPFEIKPTEGKHDFNKCKSCQAILVKITDHLTEKFEGKEQNKAFPLCCEFHSNLVDKGEFNREDFKKVPGMVARKVVFTNQHIINNHNADDWYRRISDYICWAIDSFGQMPSGCGERLYIGSYFFYVRDLVEGNNDIPKEKKKRVLELLDSCQNPKAKPKTDINILVQVYEKWLKEFPFELNSYFGHLKQHYEEKLPILTGETETNMYSGSTKTKIHTKSSLIEALTYLTNNLLTEISGVTLYEKGMITDVNKVKLELIINSRKSKLRQGYKNSSKDEEQRYRRILKEWFDDEKKFIDELISLLKPPMPLQAETRTLKLKAVFGKYGFYELSTVASLSNENKERLTELLGSHDMPYCIAMFDFLGFFKHLLRQHFDTKSKLNREVSKWFNSSRDGRAVKGNISTLSENTNEDKSKYTAHLHKETVQKDYQNLK